MLKQRVPLWLLFFALCLIGGPTLASRNSGGTYSLPAGNPVVSGTTITSTWANNTLNDIKTEITNSLDRQGRGGMLAPLLLVSGTVGAPGVGFSAEPGSGAYRAGAGDWRLTVLGTAVMKLQSALVTTLVPLTVTGRTTTTDLTVTGTSEDITIVTTGTNSYGLHSEGNGTGVGVEAIGGATNGHGLDAYGGGGSGLGLYVEGAASGKGAEIFGGTTTGNALEATARGGSSAGVVGTGIGSGSGGNFYTGVGAAATNGTAALNGIGQGNNTKGVWGIGTGTEVGVKAVGGTTGAGLEASTGTAATASARTDAIDVLNGDISMVGVASPDSNVALSNTITPKSFAKAYAAVTLGAAGSASITEGLNVSSVTTTGSACGGTTQIEITFASSFASAGKFVVIPGKASSLCDPRVISQTASTVTLGLSAIRFDGTTPALSVVNCQQVSCGAGSSVTYDWNGQKFTLVAFGAQ